MSGNLANDNPLRRMLARQQTERAARQQRLEQWARHDEDVLAYRRECRRRGKKAATLHSQLMADAMAMLQRQESAGKEVSTRGRTRKAFHVPSRNTVDIDLPDFRRSA